MSIRKIKDAKDLNNNELIYFKGHAKATYMSDGSTVEDAIKNIETNSGNIDLSDYETKLESQAKLQEAKDYTDTKIAELQEGVVTQIIELNQGYNWVSFYVKTSLQDLQATLGNKATLIGTSDNGTSTINIKTEYNAETNTWSGNLTELNYTSMYQIHCYEACSIEVKGVKLNPSELEYTIVPGTSWISYPLDKELSIAEALVGLSCVEGDLLKSHNNVAQYYNEYGWYAFDLQPMIPGKGYMYVNTTNETKTFYFPSNEEENSDFETKDDALAKLEEAKDYTNTAIANLVDSAPETLNTLNELAVAIQENEDIVEVLNQSISSKQDTITDLETIRQGAAKGATALQEHQDISSKADVDGNPNGIVVKGDNPQNPINIHPYGVIESESWKYNDTYSTEWIPDFTLSGLSLSLGSGVGVDDGFKIEAVLNIRTHDSNDEEFLRTSHTMILQYDERSSSKGTGLLLTDDFILLYAYNPESEIDPSENMTELELEVPFNDSIYDTRLRGIAEPISNHDAVNKKYVDDNYVSVNNIKTINGTSILGSGDIVIESPDMSNYTEKEYVDNKTDELKDVVTQTLSLDVGNRWYSFYVDITLKQLQQALGTNATSITTSFDGNTEVTSSYNANTNTWGGDLTTLDVTKMYRIYTNTKCEISLTGRKIPNSTSYILNPGWNWISYPLNVEVEINEALKHLEPEEGDVIKMYGSSFAEYFMDQWWPEEGIETLKPGQGYMYQNKSTEPKTLVFTTELIDVKSELNKKQNTLVSGTNIKTINGESILGEGNIVISGGSNSSGGAYALVEHSTNDTTYTLTPNTFHVWDEVANLTLTLGSETTGVANEYLFQFTSGFEPTTLILPDNVKFNSDFAIEENKIYQISILNGLGTVMSWEGDLINLITFTVDGVEYQAEEGMTWEQWCNSEYNTDGFYISGYYTYKGDKYIYHQGEPFAVILNNFNYTLYKDLGGGGAEN